jgi:hypothetical protein
MGISRSTFSIVVERMSALKDNSAKWGENEEICIAVREASRGVDVPVRFQVS